MTSYVFKLHSIEPVVAYYRLTNWRISERAWYSYVVLPQ